MALGLAAGFVGCMPSRNIVFEAPDTEEPGVRLTFFGNKHDTLNVLAIEDILRSYMDGHPDVSITYESVKGNAYYDALDKRLDAGVGDDAFMVNHDAVLELGAHGHLADLSGLATIPSFSDLALSQMGSGSAIAYVPTSISAFGLFCNMDLLKQHGLEPPRTLSDFEAACEALAQAGRAPIVANNDISLKTIALARGLAETYAKRDTAADVRAFNEDPSVLAERLRPGFDLVARIVERGWVDAQEALATEKNSDDLALFAAGERPFMLAGAWTSVRVHDLAPDMRFEVHPYPVLDDRPVLVVNVDTRVSVNADGENLEQTMDFIAHFTQPENINLFANSQCSFSPLAGNAAPDDEAVAPLAAAFGDGAVIGSDDNLLMPIWEATRKCAVAQLEGADGARAEQLLAELLASQEGDAA